MLGTYGTKGSLRTNRDGADIGTSPGINPITPYCIAANEYRHVHISPPQTISQEYTPVIRQVIWEQRLTQENRELGERRSNPFVKPPPPMRRVQYPETNGIDRSLPTNIPDHPTAIQVNGLRQETHEAIWPGYVDGTNTYDTRTLVGNWTEERADKKYEPSYAKVASGAGQWQTTYGEMTQHRDHLTIPERGSSAETIFTTDPAKFTVNSTQRSKFSTCSLGGEDGFVDEESSVDNKDLSDKWGFGGVETSGVPDQLWGDHRSNSRPATNYVNYQAGRQHTLACIKKVEKPVPKYQTTQNAITTTHQHTATSTERCDVHKPDFQVRDPTRDPMSKNLCGLRSHEFACEEDALDQFAKHKKLGTIHAERLRFTKQHTLEEYRNRWTKADPKSVQRFNSTEHRENYQEPDIKEMPLVRPSHIGVWH